MAIPPQDQWHLLPKTRAEAKRLGINWFFTGEECKYEHIAPRAACSGHCTACRRERSRERYRNERDDGVRELGTDGYYSPRRAYVRDLPSRSPEVQRVRDALRRERRRDAKSLRVDRRPPNQSKEERKAIKAFEDEVRARGNQPDHIVAFFDPQLRGLHTLANLQEVTPRGNLVKGFIGEYTPEQIEEFIQRGMAVLPEDVDEDYEHTSTPGKVDWSKYPQHCNDEDA